MVSWLPAAAILNAIQLGLADSSLSYHPDYSKLSLQNVIVIAGALICAAVLVLAIILLFTTRPKLPVIAAEPPSSRISLRKRRIDRILRLEKTQESSLSKEYELRSVEISRTSTVSKTGEQPDFIPSNTDSQLPESLRHIEGGQPVVFYFKQAKPEAATLPVYISVENDQPALAQSPGQVHSANVVTLPSATIQTASTQPTYAHGLTSSPRDPSTSLTSTASIANKDLEVPKENEQLEAKKRPDGETILKKIKYRTGKQKSGETSSESSEITTPDESSGSSGASSSSSS